MSLRQDGLVDQYTIQSELFPHPNPLSYSYVPFRNSYHIDSKEVGHGHYGVVRKCMHRENGEWYAIKSIRKAKVSKIEVLKREIDILKEVRHPNIIRLVSIWLLQRCIQYQLDVQANNASVLCRWKYMRMKGTCI